MPNSRAPARTRTAAFTFTMFLLRDVDTFPLASGPPASHRWYTCFSGLLYGLWPVPPRLASGPPASHRWYTCFSGLLYGFWPVPPRLASGPPASHRWYTCFAGLLYGFWPVPPRLAFLCEAAINRLDKCIG